MPENDSSLAGSVGRGVLASVAGTGVMTIFQKLVEMPLTGRQDSYAPANFAQKVLRVRPKKAEQRKRLNYAAHFGIGAMWGTAYGVAAHAGLRGPKAVATVFGVVYPGDVVLNTVLGVYAPTTWTTKDVVIDVSEKFIQAAATGAVFDQLFGYRSS